MFFLFVSLTSAKLRLVIIFLLFSFSFSSILAEAEARAMWVPKAAWKAMSSGSNATADHNYERERDTRFELVTQRQNQAP